MTSSIFKPWLVLALIFLAGVGTGMLLTVGFESHFKHPPGAQNIKRHWMAHLTEKLDLTADQQAKIDPIVTDASNQLQKLHDNEVGQASLIMASVNRQISDLLTPDQKAKLDKMESGRRKDSPGHLHPWMHSGEPPPGLDGPGPGGPVPPPAPAP